MTDYIVESKCFRKLYKAVEFAIKKTQELGRCEVYTYDPASDTLRGRCVVEVKIEDGRLKIITKDQL
jgi:hypothetical protein